MAGMAKDARAHHFLARALTTICSHCHWQASMEEAWTQATPITVNQAAADVMTHFSASPGANITVRHA